MGDGVEMISDLGFKYSILASGSTGNSFYLETPEKKILVDAGLSGKKITSLLAEIDRDPSDLDAILVTHEHKDHIHGVGVLARKYGMDIYANEKTWQIMDSKNMLGKIDNSQKHVFSRDKLLTFGDLDIESFGVSHDAIDPQFYRFMKDGKSFVMLTDTGYVSDKMIDYVKDSHTIVYESNHEENVLLSGPYPWVTKQRILSDKGHLSNNDSANYLTKIVGDNTKNVFLAHLSEQNNTKELARMSADMTLKNKDIDCVLEENTTIECNNKIVIMDTDPVIPTKLLEI